MSAIVGIQNKKGSVCREKIVPIRLTGTRPIRTEVVSQTTFVSVMVPVVTVTCGEKVTVTPELFTGVTVRFVTTEKRVSSCRSMSTICDNCRHFCKI